MELSEKYGPDGLRVVVLTRETALHILSLPQYADAPVTFLVEADQVFDDYNVRSIPHTILFDRDGSVALDVIGYSSGLVRRIEEALERGSAAAAPPDAGS